MKCPHCQVEIHADFRSTLLGGGAALGREKTKLPGVVGGGEATFPTFFQVDHMECPACYRPLLLLLRQGNNANKMSISGWIYPRRPTRPLAPSEVPAELAGDFNEASLVLSDSPQSSAALSRRCLQALLALQGFTHHNLAAAIDAVLVA
jgi:hypothetical protein